MDSTRLPEMTRINQAEYCAIILFGGCLKYLAFIEMAVTICSVFVFAVPTQVKLHSNF
jgi:hypothetical protein